MKKESKYDDQTNTNLNYCWVKPVNKNKLKNYIWECVQYVYSVLLTAVLGYEILRSQDYSLSRTKVIKIEIVFLRMWMGGGGGQTQKGPAGALKAQLWASRPAPSHGDAFDSVLVTKIWYFFGFWFLTVYSVQWFIQISE